MSKLTSLLNKSVGLMSRSVMRTGSIILRRRARLEALSAAIEWFVKRNNHRPLQLTHESDYGDVHLMSDGDRIQLTWWIGDKARPSDLERTDNANQSDGTIPVINNIQPVYQTDQRATAVHAHEPKPEPEPKPKSKPQPTPTNASYQLAKTSDMSNMSNNDSIGEVVGDAVGDAVGEFIGDVVETVIDEVVEQVFEGGSPREKQSVTREPTAALDTPEFRDPR